MEIQNNTLTDSAAGPYKVNHCASIHAPIRCRRGFLGSVASIWNGGMLIAAVTLAPRYLRGGGRCLRVFAGNSMCTGHSVVSIAALIHRTFQCPKCWSIFWSGPARSSECRGRSGDSGADFRDWATRQPIVIPTCAMVRACSRTRSGSALSPEAETRSWIRSGSRNWRRPLFRFLSRTWSCSNFSRAVLYAIGGMPWLCVGNLRACDHRCIMHWFVGYICHSHVRRAGSSTRVRSRRITCRGSHSLDG